jgi:hypothetical protein
MTMQLAFEAVSPEAHRLSFLERSSRVRAEPRRRRVELPHVDDTLFAIALLWLFTAVSAQFCEGVHYAVGVQPGMTVGAAAAPHVDG